MLRLLGIVFSGSIVASVVLPWVSGPQIGAWAPIDLLKNVDFSRITLDQFKDFFSTPVNGDPVNATPWAIAAFAASFPLAALFTLLGVFGYFSKFMGVLLGVIPLAVAGFAYYVYARVQQSAPAGFDILQTINNGLQTKHINFGWGVPLYLGTAALLLLTALFSPDARRR